LYAGLKRNSVIPKDKNILEILVNKMWETHTPFLEELADDANQVRKSQVVVSNQSLNLVELSQVGRV